MIKVRSEYLSLRDSRRRMTNILMLVLLGVATLVAVAPLIAIFIYIIQQGFGALNLDFFTALPAPVGELGGGMANAMLGSGILLLLAALVGVPWGVGVGVYLSEFGSGRFGRVVRFMTDLLTSVPSIVVGLFAYAVLVKPMKSFSAYAGAAALAVIMVPLIARTTEEIVRLVPQHVREAGLALGLPRWKVTLRIVLKASMGGIVTGVMLSISRVAGETAPLLFTAFGNAYWSKGLNEPIASLPVQIFSYAISPFDEWHRKAWAGALILVVFVFIMNLAMRWVFSRGRR